MQANNTGLYQIVPKGAAHPKGTTFKLVAPNNSVIHETTNRRALALMQARFNSRIVLDRMLP